MSIHVIFIPALKSLDLKLFSTSCVKNYHFREKSFFRNQGSFGFSSKTANKRIKHT